MSDAICRGCNKPIETGQLVICACQTEFKYWKGMDTFDINEYFSNFFFYHKECYKL